MRTLFPPAVQGRLARPWLAMGAVLALLGAGLGGQFLTKSQSHAASPCESGSNVGEFCRFLNVVSAGPDYDIEGWLRADPNGGREFYHWKENNPDYTTWWWRYNQFNGAQAYMAIQINLRGDDNLGFPPIDKPEEGVWRMQEDRCFLITVDRKVIKRDCAVKGGAATSGGRADM
jgi:hypothetical protein